MDDSSLCQQKPYPIRDCIEFATRMRAFLKAIVSNSLQLHALTR